jgi:hypothetical protein
MLFDLIGDREIFHRDVALALNVAEQPVATHPESSRALTGGEICSHYPKPDSPFATRPGHLPSCPRATALEKRCRSPERQQWAQSRLAEFDRSWPKAVWLLWSGYKAKAAVRSYSAG